MFVYYKLCSIFNQKASWVFKKLFIVINSPSFHQVHHHFKQPYTNCNYGDVLSIWDRMFGAFQR